MNFARILKELWWVRYSNDSAAGPSPIFRPRSSPSRTSAWRSWTQVRWWAGRAMFSQNVCTYILDLKRAKIPKSHQNTKIHPRLKMLKYRQYRRRFWRPRRHFSAFFTLYPKILSAVPQNFQIDLEKCWKMPPWTSKSASIQPIF